MTVQINMNNSKPRYTVGYARVSTGDQNLRMQVDALNRYGKMDQIITETKSGKALAKRKLKLVLDALRKGDVLVVWRLDRLGRSLSELMLIVKHIEDVGAELVSLTESIDTRSAMGKLFFHIIAAFAEFERESIAERTREGMRAAKAAGKRIGPLPLITGYPARLRRLRALDKAGKLRDVVGNFIMADIPILLEMNAIKDAPPIKNVATVRRWRNKGAVGLDVVPVET